jgi:hypothetical protein
MRVAMMAIMAALPKIHFGTKASEAPVDFYAGAVAAFVVIVFAKFATYTHTHKHTYKGPAQWVVGPRGHALCIWCAWVGLMLSLAMLGRLALSAEVLVRGVVGFLAVLAGGILSLDTGLQRNEPVEAEGTGSVEAKRTNDPARGAQLGPIPPT